MNSSEPPVCVNFGSFIMPKAGQNSKKRSPFRIIWVVRGVHSLDDVNIKA
jgi:hypothetical protein